MRCFPGRRPTTCRTVPSTRRSFLARRVGPAHRERTCADHTGVRRSGFGRVRAGRGTRRGAGRGRGCCGYPRCRGDPGRSGPAGGLGGDQERAATPADLGRDPGYRQSDAARSAGPGTGLPSGLGQPVAAQSGGPVGSPAMPAGVDRPGSGGSGGLAQSGLPQPGGAGRRVGQSGGPGQPQMPQPGAGQPSGAGGSGAGRPGGPPSGLPSALAQPGVAGRSALPATRPRAGSAWANPPRARSRAVSANTCPRRVPSESPVPTALRLPPEQATRRRVPIGAWNRRKWASSTGRSPVTPRSPVPHRRSIRRSPIRKP